MIEAVCFDSGDTLAAEETVIHDSSGRAITANVIEGAFKVLEAIRKDGYKVADVVAGRVGLPLLHIGDATGSAIKEQDLHTVGLLGTRFVMGEQFYRERLREQFGAVKMALAE